MVEIIVYIITFLLVSIGFVILFGAPYIPTLRVRFADIMTVYSLKKNDVFVDLGSGDGAVLRAAATKSANVVGFEISPWLWLISKFLSRKQKNVTIFYGNFWSQELPSGTTVVYTFLRARFMSKLEQKLQNHVDKNGKNLHLISYGFRIVGKKAIKTHGPMRLYVFKPNPEKTLQTQAH